MREPTVIPAIIASTQQEFSERVNKVAEHADILQLDFMDGVFVDNRSLDFDFKTPDVDCSLEAHLMVDDPLEWVSEYADRVDLVLAPIETTDDPVELMDAVRDSGALAGFVLNPSTGLDTVSDFLGDVDQILLMTVHPGAYGAKFLPEVLPKITELREMMSDLDVEVDGGIKPDTIRQTYDAGANMFVSGSYIVKSEDPAEAIRQLHSNLE